MRRIEIGVCLDRRRVVIRITFLADASMWVSSGRPGIKFSVGLLVLLTYLLPMKVSAFCFFNLESDYASLAS